MNVQAPRQMNVIATPCVPTLKDPTFAAVFEATKEMAKVAPVRLVKSKRFNATIPVKLVLTSSSLFVPNRCRRMCEP